MNAGEMSKGTIRLEKNVLQEKKHTVEKQEITNLRHKSK